MSMRYFVFCERCIIKFVINAYKKICTTKKITPAMGDVLSGEMK